MEVLHEDDEWSIKVRSAGWNEESASDQPEYDVNPEPLGRCPFEEECRIVESPREYICERKLKEAEFTKEELKQRKADGVPQSCGFVFPRTICKREIVRDEAMPYVKEGKTELLTDFTSRFGRPFSATLVLKDTGRHGFEFPPRKARGGGDAEEGAKSKKKTTRKKKTAKKKTTKKKTAKKKTARKKKTSAKKSTAKKTARKKKTTRKKASAAATSSDD